MNHATDDVNFSSFYKSCTLCPRNCKVDRTQNVNGFCGEPDKIRISVACLHFGEEPLITVHGGSGTIFLTGCNLRCAFCQNYQISQQGMGREVSKEGFATICLKLEDAGAENINIVTGSHATPAIAEGLLEAKKQGLNIPICWNSSGYDSIESLELLKGIVTLYLPDLKTLNKNLSKDLFSAEDYPDKAKKALLWMIQNNPLKIININKKEKLMSGVIVRHLFLPGRFEETAEVLYWLKENADGKAIISLMNQYTPVPFKEENEKLEKRKQKLMAIENRLVNKTEFEDLTDIIEAYSFENLFYQELTDDTSWLPDFERTQPFSNKLATPIWHWKQGFIEK